MKSFTTKLEFLREVHQLAGWDGSFLMVYTNKAISVGAGFISVCVKTRWLGQKRGFYVPELYCICKHIHRHTYMHMHTHAHAHIHTYMHTHIHWYTCTRTSIHRQKISVTTTQRFKQYHRRTYASIRKRRENGENVNPVSQHQLVSS